MNQREFAGVMFAAVGGGGFVAREGRGGQASTRPRRYRRPPRVEAPEVGAIGARRGVDCLARSRAHGWQLVLAPYRNNV
jgi:hypothetical protein